MCRKIGEGGQTRLDAFGSVFGSEIVYFFFKLIVQTIINKSIAEKTQKLLNMCQNYIELDTKSHQTSLPKQVANNIMKIIKIMFLYDV